jgi:N-acetyl-gamma-glutamyl-phosphate reductase common form
MITVGVVGASGYMGGEAVRILFDHPEAKLLWLTSRTPGPIEEVHPNMYGSGLFFVDINTVDTPDFVFLAVPTDASIDMAARFLESGSRVIDLGSAFRLKDRKTWETVYAQRHGRWDLCTEAVYGIPELHMAEISRARLVANPGCFSSAAILGLAPLIKKRLVDTDHLVIDGLSGTVGAGAELSRAAHHPEIGDNIVPYNVVDHRHTYEIEQELGILAEDSVRIHFTSSYVPIVRGIVDICHCFTDHAADRDNVLEVYREFYKGQPFVQIYDLPKDAAASWQYKPYPWVSSVSGTNYCHIGLDVDEKRGRIVVISVLDSIGKGGAQVGIENMNIMAGFDRKAGLSRRGLHPR